MVRRALGALLTVGVLCTTGVASGTPCCTLLGLEPDSRPRVEDCCTSSDCCRIEKRGPAQTAPLSRASEDAGPATLSVGHPPFAGETAGASVALSDRTRFFETDHPPPPAGRNVYLRISLLRI
jgi:hypothetical protein